MTRRSVVRISGSRRRYLVGSRRWPWTMGFEARSPILGTCWIANERRRQSMSFRQSFEHVLRRWSGRNVAQRFQSAAPDSGGDHVDTVTSSDQEPRPSVSNLGITPREQALAEQTTNGGSSGTAHARAIRGGALWARRMAAVRSHIRPGQTHWDTVIFADVDSGTLRTRPGGIQSEQCHVGG